MANSITAMTKLKLADRGLYLRLLSQCKGCGKPLATSEADFKRAGELGVPTCSGCVK